MPPPQHHRGRRGVSCDWLSPAAPRRPVETSAGLASSPLLYAPPGACAHSAPRSLAHEKSCAQTGCAAPPPPFVAPPPPPLAAATPPAAGGLSALRRAARPDAPPLTKAAFWWRARPKCATHIEQIDFQARSVTTPPR